MSNKLTNRITGADVVAGLIDQTQLKGKKVALIGGFGYQNISPTEFPGVSRLNLEHNQTQLYWCSAYQDISQPSETEEKAVQNFISSYKPDIVFVALGAPWQERWLISHREFLERAGVKLAMVVGGAFDFLTGRVRRAPPRWQKWHLEWLWRLWQQPWRARRQLALVEFVWRVWWKQYN